MPEGNDWWWTLKVVLQACILPASVVFFSASAPLCCLNWMAVHGVGRTDKSRVH